MDPLTFQGTTAPSVPSTLIPPSPTSSGLTSRIFSGCRNCVPSLSGRAIWIIGAAAAALTTALFAYYVKGVKAAHQKTLLIIKKGNEIVSNTERLAPKQRAENANNFLKEFKIAYPGLKLDLEPTPIDGEKADETVTSILNDTILPKVIAALNSLEPANK